MKPMHRLLCFAMAALLGAGMFAFPISAADPNVKLCGNESSFQKIGKDEMYAAQVKLSEDAGSFSVKATNYGTAAASLTLTVYQYKTDYTETLIGQPIARKEFTGFTDKSMLEIEGDFKKGEYIITAVSPNGDAGFMKCSVHESQLTYKDNKKYSSNICLTVTYKSEPSVKYEKPTPQKSDDGEQDFAPCMDVYMDFRLKETYEKYKNCGANEVSMKYGDGNTVFHVNKSGDPFVWFDTNLDGAMMPLTNIR